MARVFISYRRNDCAGHAGRLYDHLVERFGDDAVFRDIDAIEPGVDFGERIEKAVGACSVLIALIGDEWLDIADSAGRRRLDDPADLVRLEIGGALRRSDLPVIPVLVEGAAMPDAEDLPDDLKPLARRNALELSDGRWRYDADRLIEVVERVAFLPPRSGAVGVSRGRVDQGRAEAAPAPVAPTRRRVPTGPLALGGGIAAVVAVVVVLLAGLNGGPDGPAPDDARGHAGGGGRPTPQPPTADDPVPSVTRPLALALRGDQLAVLGATGDLRFMTVNTREEIGPRLENLGVGANRMAAGFGLLWVTKHTTSSLIRIDPLTHRRAGPAIKLPKLGLLFAVATGEGAVWVGTQKKGERSHVVKVTPTGHVIASFPVDGQASEFSDLAVGDGAVWVTTRSATVVRISVRDGRQQRIDVGREPRGLAIGDGAVWVANHGDRSVTSINSRTRHFNASIALGVAPERVAVGGGSVWVTARDANQLIRIDSRRMKVRAKIPTKPEPYALGVGRGHEVWLTLVGDGAVQRVGFTR